MQAPTKLFNRNYLLLWQGQAVSKIGSQLYLIAVILWIKHATESGTLVSLIPAVSGIIAVLMGPIAGTFADYHSRRRIIIMTDFLSGLAVISLAIVVFFNPAATSLIVVWIFGLSIILSITTSFFGPAIEASIPDLVPKNKVQGANTMSQFSNQISMLVGQGAGGWLYPILGGPLIFLFNGISYLFSAFSESFIVIPQNIPKQKEGRKEKLMEFKANMIAGFKYIWNKNGLRELFFVSALLNFFTMPVINLLVFFVEDHLQLKSGWYGILIALYGIGSFFGYIFGSTIKFSRQTRCKFIIMFLIFESTIYGLFGFMTHIYPTLFLAWLAGFMAGFIGLNVTTILQVTTPGEIRGRIFGVLGTLAGSIAPIGMALGGAFFDLVDQNITLVYGVCGGAMVSLAIMIAFNKNFREYISVDLSGELSH